MAGAKIIQQDLFMQFKFIEVELDDADAAACVTSFEDTGLSIRGNYAMLIHRVDWNFRLNEARYETDFALRAALTVDPTVTVQQYMDDIGVIDVMEFNVDYEVTTSGGLLDHVVKPFTRSYVPPVIICAPKLGIVVSGDGDKADWRSLEIKCRVGYTTIPIDEKMYLEIAETWRTL